MEAEKTENPIVIEEAMSKAVNRVVKWFILILVIVFDPLAVTLVIAYNASLLRGKNPQDSATLAEQNNQKGAFFSWANAPIFLLIAAVIAWFVYDRFPTLNPTEVKANAKASFLNKLSAKRFDDRAFAYRLKKLLVFFSFSD